MFSSWPAILLALTLIGTDLLLILALIIVVALFIGFLGISAFRGYIESLINELIRDILAELHGYIMARQGKVAGYTSVGLGLVKKLYSIVYFCYDLFQTAILILIAASVSVIALVLIAVLMAVNTVLAYVVAAYIL